MRSLSVLWMALAVLSTSAFAGQTTPPFLKVRGEQDGHLGYFGLVWSDTDQSISVYGYKGSWPNGLVQDKFFGSATVASMEVPGGKTIIYRIHGPLGIVLKSIHMTFTLCGVTHDQKLGQFGEGTLTFDAGSFGNASLLISETAGDQMRAAFQNQIIDEIYFKNGKVSSTPF